MISTPEKKVNAATTVVLPEEGVVEGQLPEEEVRESYVPKMKPGDVEIPNRVFVKGFPKEATADDLFVFFEDYGRVLECRIVADRYGYSKGYGFITFDSQSVADKVKEMERIKYTDDIELAIGPARIRKKRYYLLPTPQYQQPQAYYTQDGSVFWATCLPQQQVMQPTQIVSPVQVVHQSPNAPAYAHQAPVSQGGYGPPPPQSAVPQSYNNQSPALQQQQQHQYTTTPIQQQPQQSYTPVAAHQQSYMGQQSYGSPVVFSMVSSEQGLGGNQSPPCMYQSNGQNMTTLVEKVSGMQISTSPGAVADDAVVPNLGPGTYMEMQQPLNGQETIVYNPVVSFVPHHQQRHMQ